MPPLASVPARKSLLAVHVIYRFNTAGGDYMTKEKDRKWGM
jgi:hypothetical protein